LLLFGAGSRLIGSSTARGFAGAIATDSPAST
jgi:hypothetical protein